MPFKKLLLFILVSCCAFAQNYRVDDTVVGRNGMPVSAATIAVCSQVGITAISEVVGTVTVTTTLSPPQGSTVTIVGVTPTAYNGSYTVLTTSPTSFTYTNPTQGLGVGTIFGSAVVTSTTPCAPLANLCSSYTDTVCASPNPVTGDGLGNYHFFIAPGHYTRQFYGSGLTARVQTDQVFPCDPAATCTLSGNLNLGSNSFTAGAVNNVKKCETFAGATADVKIAACLAAIPSGGVADARGFGATTQSLAAQITVGANQTLLFDPATLFQSSTSSLNLFKVQLDGVVKGFTFDCGNQPAYTGILFQNDTTQFYTNGNNTEIADIKTSTNCSGVTGYTALKLSSTSVTLGVSFIKIHGWRIWGGVDGIFMTTSGTGFVNGNHLSDMVLSNMAHGWHITGVASGTISGNVCALCSYEKDSVGVNGILIDGAAAAALDGNTWFGSIWDTTVPIAITNPNAAKNTFYGRFDGTYSDNSGQLNNFIDGGNAQALPTMALRGAQVKTLVGGSQDTLDLFDITPSAANPHKFFRINGGTLQLLNSGFSAVILSLDNAGNMGGLASVGASGGANFGSYGTATNCNVNSVSPAACGSAASGVVVVPTTTTTYTVNTTVVTATSRIQVWPITDNSGISGAPTCNAPPTPFIGYQSARVASTSFTFTLPSTAGTSCWNYSIMN